jgi:hypothetical protein
MSDPWSSFIVVISVQFLLFLLHAYYEKRLADVPRILGWSILIGVVFGIAFDLAIGKFLGLYFYELGFGLTFLTLNGAFSYGLMQANTLLMERAGVFHFYIWTLIVGIVYEITNSFFRVWTWDFSTPFLEVVAVHLVGYIGLAVCMALIWHAFLGHKFVFIDMAFKALPFRFR